VKINWGKMKENSEERKKIRAFVAEKYDDEL